MIKTAGLRKAFRSGKTTVEAVRGVDLDVGDGEIFGFLGPNGAGKTTTLRMLATLIRPDGGSALIAGVDLMHRPAEVRRRIGYVAQGGGTWEEVSAREELVYQGRLHRLSTAESRRRADAAIEAFQLGEFADRPCKTYSGGQRRRLDVALGVIHRPAVVFLDEPTTGLDPQSRAHMWTEVRRLREEGMTVFLTTHYLEEADALCDRVAIIDHGAIVALDTPAELKRQPYLRELERTAAGLRLVVEDGAVAIPQILRSVDAAAVPLTSIELHRPSLDDVFLARTGRSLRDSEQKS